MKHHQKNRKFGRKANVRLALVRSLMLALLEHGRITTTEARAKEIRPRIEKMVTRALNDSVANRRLLNARLGSNQESAVKKLVEEIAPKYKDRNGGYTRIVKLPQRASDAAPMAIIEFV